jgi:hypothetical protein
LSKSNSGVVMKKQNDLAGQPGPLYVISDCDESYSTNQVGREENSRPLDVMIGVGERRLRPAFFLDFAKAVFDAVGLSELIDRGLLGPVFRS